MRIDISFHSSLVSEPDAEFFGAGLWDQPAFFSTVLDDLVDRAVVPREIGVCRIYRVVHGKRLLLLVGIWRLCRTIFAWVITSSRVVVLFPLNMPTGRLPIDMANNSSSDLLSKSFWKVIMVIPISWFVYSQND